MKQILFIYTAILSGAAAFAQSPAGRPASLDGAWQFSRQTCRQDPVPGAAQVSGLSIALRFENGLMRMQSTVNEGSVTCRQTVESRYEVVGEQIRVWNSDGVTVCGTNRQRMSEAERAADVKRPFLVRIGPGGKRELVLQNDDAVCPDGALQDLVFEEARR